MAMKIDSMRWKERFPNAGIKVEVAHAAITKIKEKNGGTVAPEHIVEEAKNPKHALHKCFTWDDTEAANKYRIREAGTLLRSIEITYAESPEQPRRAFEVTTRKKAGDKTDLTLYSTAEEAAADPASHSALVAEAVRTLMAWRARFRYLQELSHLIEEIDRTLASLAK